MTTKAMNQVPRQQLMQQQMQAQTPGEGQPPPNGAPFSAAPPMPAQAPAASSPPAVVVEDARLSREREQREAAQRQVTEERAARERLEAELARRDEAQRAAALASLPPDQQVVSRLSEVERNLAQERANFQSFRQQQAHEQRAYQLALYRERAVRDVPPEVAGMVGGTSELEIDASVDNAIKTFQQMEANIRARLESEVQARMATANGYQPVPIPPPNPHYVPAYTAHPGAAGFPTVVNPAPMVQQEQGVVGMELSGMTSEEAVRSGRYSGEMRNRIHQNLRQSVGQAYPGAMGSTPRHWNQQQIAQPMQHIPQPGGVMQPQGIPMQPAMNPQQYQQPQQYAQQPQPMMLQQQPQPTLTGLPMMPASIRQPPTAQPTMGSSNAAQEAIARLHAGQSTVLHENQGAAQQLADANKFAQQRGIASPQAAFSERFSQG